MTGTSFSLAESSASLVTDSPQEITLPDRVADGVHVPHVVSSTLLVYMATNLSIDRPVTHDQ